MNTDAFKVLFFFYVEVMGMEQMPSIWRNQPLDIIGSLFSLFSRDCPSSMKLDEGEGGKKKENCVWRVLVFSL